MLLQKTLVSRVKLLVYGTALAMFLVSSASAQTGFRETALTHTAINVTTSTGEALVANTSRRWLLIENDSDTVIYCKVGVAAVLNQGIRLNANGGSWELSPSMGNYNTGAVNCIHGGTGNKVLLVTEGQ